MNFFDNISDEQLGCFIEDNLCEADCNTILDAVSCDSDMDILSISYHANQLFDNDFTGDTTDDIFNNDITPSLDHRTACFCAPIRNTLADLEECDFDDDDDTYLYASASKRSHKDD